MNDIPVPERHYDFLREGNAPGDQFKAIDQCHQSFGPKFVPHVKENEPPFEVRHKILNPSHAFIISLP